jgi:hypothetical protein
MIRNPAQTPVMPRAYWISSHVHIRNTLDGSVLLDLRRDKYLGLGKEETVLLAAAVNEWPEPLWASSVDVGAVDASARSTELCASLLEDGLISASPPVVTRDKRAQEMDLRMDWVSIGDELDMPGQMRFRDIVKFLMAFASAWLSLKCGRLERTVKTVRKSRRGAQVGNGALRVAVEGDEPDAEGDQPSDIFRMARAVDVFRRMRTYVFAAEGRCLLHALTLTKFLSRYGFHTHWVIGIRTQPWGAHSWVQWQEFLLDTTPEKVGKFLPILVV